MDLCIACAGSGKLLDGACPLCDGDRLFCARGVDGIGTPSAQITDEVIGPRYSPSPETVKKNRVPRGIVHQLVMKSVESKIYPGIQRRNADVATKQADTDIYDDRFRGLDVAPADLGFPEFDGHGHNLKGHPMNAHAATPDLSEPQTYERGVKVYVPESARVSQNPAPFIVVNDGLGFAKIMVPVLDNLVAEGRVPSNLVAIFVHSGGSDAQGSQRGLEYDTMSGVFAEFCESEVLPFVSTQCGVMLTKDPDGRAAMGASSGGCAAFSMAWFRPDLFQRVLSYSGTFVNQQYPYNSETPRGGWEYHSGKELIANSPKKPIRVCLVNPERDLCWDLPERTWHNWTLANTRMASVLKRKGYDCRHVFCREAGHIMGHVAKGALAQTLAGDLEWLFAGLGK